MTIFFQFFTYIIAASGAHVHGLGTVNIAAVNNNVEFEFAVPGEDLVGFEYEAKTSAEKSKVQKIKKKLQTTPIIKIDDRAKCEHSDFDFKRDQHKHGDEVHSEYRITYRYDCSALKRLNWVEFNAFELLPSLTKINANLVTENKQMKKILRKGKSRIFGLR